MVDALERAKSMDIISKSPHLFGQKLEKVLKIAQQTQSPFRKSKAVSEHLNEFQSYAEMRGWLGHSSIEVAQNDKSEEIIIFTQPGNKGFIPGQQAKCISFSDMKKINQSLKKLVKLICDQRLKPMQD